MIIQKITKKHLYFLFSKIINVNNKEYCYLYLDKTKFYILKYGVKPLSKI